MSEEKSEKFTLRSVDGHLHSVERNIIEQSATVRDIVADVNDLSVPIDLPNITNDTLVKVLAFCTHFAAHPEDVSDDGKKSPSTVLTEWEEGYCKIDLPALFALIQAANFLDIPALLDLTCLHVALMIRDKSAEDIRTLFQIRNDFTPEEEAQVRKENEWCESG